MSYSRIMDPLHTKSETSPSVEFHPYAWSQVDNKRALIETDSGPPSPKRMVMDFTHSDEEPDSPIVIHINSGESLVVTGDNDSSIAEGKSSLPYLESINGARGPITEDNLIRKNDVNCDYNEPAEINGFPVYKLRRHAPFLNETLELCMGVHINKDLVCHQIPSNVQVSAIFVVDFQSIHHHDVVAKDKNSFGRQSSPTRHVALKLALDRVIKDIKTIKNMTENMCPEPGFEFYKIRRHYTWHKYIVGLSRIITRLEYKNELFRYGMVQFKLADEDKSFASNFKPSLHTPTAEKTTSFVQRPSPRPTPETNRTQVRTQQAPNTFQKPTSALNSTAIPASNNGTPKLQEPTPSSSSSCKNEIFNILQNADRPRPQLSKVADFSKLLSILKCDDFLCDVSFCSFVGANDERCLNPRTFAMGELQKHWLQSFCTGTCPKSIVNISTIHTHDNMYITVLTCSLPVFILKDDPSKHPTVLLALMTSLTNEKQDYEYLASNLRRKGIKQMVYGTDGVESLDEVLERNFPSKGVNGSIHLCCFDKAKETITQKLDSMKLKSDVKVLITKQIFGFDLENAADCLVDQKTDLQFQELWSNVEKSWPSAFREWTRRPQDDGDRCFLDTIRYSMLRPVRAAAGLGDPPDEYINAVNCRGINDAISELEQESKQSVELAKVHEIFRNRAVDGQITDFVKAMYNMGQLRLSKEYQHLTVSLLSVDK